MKNRKGLFMVVPASTLSDALRKRPGNFVINNNIRVEVFGPYAVASAYHDNSAADELFLDLAEGWGALKPAFREAIQDGMDIPERFFELGQLWQITRDQTPSADVTFQRLCPYLRHPIGTAHCSAEDE